jgi:hypothetical protein
MLCYETDVTIYLLLCDNVFYPAMCCYVPNFFYIVHSQSRTVHQVHNLELTIRWNDHQVQNSSNNVNNLASTTLSSAKFFKIITLHIMLKNPPYGYKLVNSKSRPRIVCDSGK